MNSKKNRAATAVATAEQVESTIITLERDIHPLMLEAGELRVTDQKSAGVAADFLRRVKDGIKAADKSRKELVDPLNAVIKDINARFKALMAPAEQAEATVKRGVADFFRAEEGRARAEAAQLQREQDKAQAKAEKKADKKGWELPPPPPPVVVAAPDKSIAGVVGAVQVRKVWTFAVENANAIPREYLKLDETLVRDALRRSIAATGQPPIVAGLRFFQDTRVAV